MLDYRVLPGLPGALSDRDMGRGDRIGPFHLQNSVCAESGTHCVPGSEQLCLHRNQSTNDLSAGAREAQDTPRKGEKEC